MNNAPFITFIKDEQGRFLYYNDRMARHFGITMEEWIGKSDFEIWPREVAQVLHLNDLEVMASDVRLERHEETIDAAGQLTVWKIHKFSWKDERGQVRIGGIGIDLSQEMQRERALADANRKLQKLAAIDALTGLSNRRVLDERVEFEFKLAKRHHTELSVVLFDIDNFKRRNDVFGHASGDAVLETLGQIVISSLRATDVAARYGGEEFVVLLPGADAEGARIFAHRLRDRFRETNWPDEACTASFGIAAMDRGTISGRRLIELADRAMYEAKRTGKDRVVDYHEVPANTLPGSRRSVG